MIWFKLGTKKFLNKEAIVIAIRAKLFPHPGNLFLKPVIAHHSSCHRENIEGEKLDRKVWRKDKRYQLDQ